MSETASFLSGIETALKPLIEAEKGQLNIATDVDDALQLLVTAPNRFRVVLTWDGFGDHPEAINGVNQMRFLVIVQQARGMSKDPSDSLHRQAHQVGEPPFLDRLEQVSGWFRALRFPGRNCSCEGLALTDSNWVGDAPAKTRAHALTFSLVVAHPPLPPAISLPNPNE